MAKDARRRLVVCPQCGRSRFTTTPDKNLRLCRLCGTTIHGMWKSRLYNIWSHIRSRTGVIGHSETLNREDYADRGITLCEEWNSFERFRDWALSSGYTDELEIDRKDNDGPYSPDNSHWTTRKQNLRNTRRNRVLTAFGKTQCLAAWVEELGLDYQLIRGRLRLGWSDEKALTTPLGAVRPGRKKLAP